MDACGWLPRGLQNRLRGAVEASWVGSIPSIPATFAGCDSQVDSHISRRRRALADRQRLHRQGFGHDRPHRYVPVIPTLFGGRRLDFCQPFGGVESKSCQQVIKCDARSWNHTREISCVPARARRRRAPSRLPAATSMSSSVRRLPKPVLKSGSTPPTTGDGQSCVALLSRPV
jgi:hypothetical protein